MTNGTSRTRIFFPGKGNAVYSILLCFSPPPSCFHKSRSASFKTTEGSKVHSVTTPQCRCSRCSRHSRRIHRLRCERSGFRSSSCRSPSTRRRSTCAGRKGRAWSTSRRRGCRPARTQSRVLYRGVDLCKRLQHVVRDTHFHVPVARDIE